MRRQRLGTGRLSAVVITLDTGQMGPAPRRSGQRPWAVQRPSPLLERLRTGPGKALLTEHGQRLDLVRQKPHLARLGEARADGGLRRIPQVRVRGLVVAERQGDEPQYR